MLYILELYMITSLSVICDHCAAGVSPKGLQDGGDAERTKFRVYA